MARKAGQVRLGEEAASQAVLDHKARLILVAADAGEDDGLQFYIGLGAEL